MKPFPEYERFDGMGLAELVRKRQITPEELLEAAVVRIEIFNPQLNAVIEPMYDQALEQLKEGADWLQDAPFAGVPFLLKDLLAACAGTPLRNGSRFFKQLTPIQDSLIVRRFKRAGLLIIGKTNTPELGITPVTEPELFGPTHNPYDLQRTAGGSSGGSAAAVASRMVPMAHGGDGGGSIRIPASCCGLFGLKPTRGRIPSSTLYEPWQGSVNEHVLTRSVRDSAAMLDATSGYSPGVPYTAPTEAAPFLAQVDLEPGKLRIAFTAEPFMGDHVDEACYRGLMETVNLCRDLGHEMIEAYPQIDGPALSRAFLTMITGEINADIQEAEKLLARKATAREFERDTWALNLLGRQVAAGDFVRAIRTFQRTSYIVADFFREYDLLLTPTLAEPPVFTGSLLTQGVEAVAMDVINWLNAGKLLRWMGMIDTAADRVYRFMPYTPLFNMTGSPAMSVPLHWTADGLPIGMHFAGRFADEATLFRLAGQLERAQPWVDKAPQMIHESNSEVASMSK